MFSISIIYVNFENPDLRQNLDITLLLKKHKFSAAGAVQYMHDLTWKTALKGTVQREGPS
jgi:hypothetical protein